MQLGETIATYDVALALRGESGKFDVTSPTGELYHVTCTPNHSITNLQCSGNGASAQPFLIRKVAEPVSAAPQRSGTGGPEMPTQARVAKAPFLIGTETEAGSEKMAARDDAQDTPEPDARAEETPRLDLLFVEVAPKTQQPTAWVSLDLDPQEARRTLVSNACISFNELDVEIRRLHAQLDDIRYRARKKFYQAHVVAAGA